LYCFGAYPADPDGYMNFDHLERYTKGQELKNIAYSKFDY